MTPPLREQSPTTGTAPSDALIGRTLGHFRVDERIGSGGMGVVYRGRDLHLDRDVAVKVLPPDALGDEVHVRRFRREAAALSRLAHPHIGTIFDFDAQDGMDFLVMELVPGETLARRIAGDSIAIEHVIDLGAQIAGALEAAHEHGIIHRDLKPENVIVTPRGQAKVLDFGLARPRAPDGPPTGPALTEPDLVLGTLPYMAPEQLLGGIVDPRTDVFALGGLLYQMTTGSPPFTERLSTALVHEILNRAPRPLRSLRFDVPAALESVIMRCLEKDPARRYASATEVRLALAAIAVPRPAIAAAPRLQAIAVLPLQNLTRDPEQDWFADGMTESLIAELARLKPLRVVSRTSGMRFRGTTKPLTEVARELGVDGIVEGSVLRDGGRVRITARLIDAANEQVLWGDRYERDLSDVLALQVDVAATIARAIHLSVAPAEHERTAVRTVDPEAYEAYLKGRYHWKRRTEPELRRGIEQFERAIERDPTYARAYSGLADSYNILADNNWIAPEIGFARARAAARRALDLEPDLAEAYASLAYVSIYYDWNWNEAIALYRRAIELGPDYPTAHQWYGQCLVSLGRFDEGVAELRRAIELDPLATVLFTSLGDSLYYAGRFAEAIEHNQQALTLDPGFYLAWTDLARSYEQAGRFDEAIAAFKKGAELMGRDPELSSGLACTYGFAGRRDEAVAIRDRLIEPARATLLAAKSKTRSAGTSLLVPAYAIASIQASLGEIEAAFEWLDIAVNARDRALVWTKVNPRFRRLRKDPHFYPLIARIGLPA